MEPLSTSASERVVDVAREVLSLAPSVREEPARLPFLLYLIDWKSAIEHGKTITGLNWYVHAFDPDPESVVRAEGWPELYQRMAERLGAITTDVVKPSKTGALSDEDEEVVMYVASRLGGFPWREFLRVVFTTFPVQAYPRPERVDLVELARVYRSQRKGTETRNASDERLGLREAL